MAALVSATASYVRASAFRSKVLNLAKTQLDRIEVRGVFGQKHEARPDVSDRSSYGLCPVGAEVVEDDDVARLEGRNEELFNIGAEAFAVDGPVEQAGRIDAVVAQGGKESRGLLQRPCGTLSTSRWPFGAQRRAGGSCWFSSTSRR